MTERARCWTALWRERPLEPAEEGGLGGLVNFALGFLRRQYLVIIFTAALALAASAIYLRITPPTYTGQVKVLFGNSKAQFVQQQSLLAETRMETPQLEPQLQILKSDTIAIAVINQLKLAEDPDFKASRPFLSSLWRSIRGRFVTLAPAQPAGLQERPLDGIVAAFEDRLSAARVGVS